MMNAFMGSGLKAGKQLSPPVEDICVKQNLSSIRPACKNGLFRLEILIPWQINEAEVFQLLT